MKLLSYKISRKTRKAILFVLLSVILAVVVGLIVFYIVTNKQTASKNEITLKGQNYVLVDSGVPKNNGEYEPIESTNFVNQYPARINLLYKIRFPNYPSDEGITEGSCFIQNDAGDSKQVCQRETFNINMLLNDGTFGKKTLAVGITNLDQKFTVDAWIKQDVVDQNQYSYNFKFTGLPSGYEIKEEDMIISASLGDFYDKINMWVNVTDRIHDVNDVTRLTEDLPIDLTPDNFPLNKFDAFNDYNLVLKSKFLGWSGYEYPLQNLFKLSHFVDPIYPEVDGETDVTQDPTGVRYANNNEEGKFYLDYNEFLTSKILWINDYAITLSDPQNVSEVALVEERNRACGEELNNKWKIKLKLTFSEETSSATLLNFFASGIKLAKIEYLRQTQCSVNLNQFGIGVAN